MGFLKANLLLFCVAAGLALAWMAPEAGRHLAALGMVQVLVVCTFLLLGFGLDTTRRASGGELSRAMIWGLVVSQVAGPVVGVVTARIFAWDLGDQVGFIIKCCMAPTFVSGAVLAQRAKGDFPLALMLAVGINALAVFTIPYALAITLGAEVHIAILPLLLKMVGLVLVPALAGQALRRARPGWVAPSAVFVKYAPQAALGLVIYLSISLKVEHFLAVSAGRLLSLAWAAMLAHGSLLAVSYLGARWLLRLPEPACRSGALVCAQKSLPLAVAVWTMAFADRFPGALVPAMVFHPLQILMGGVLAGWWARRRGGAGEQAACLSGVPSGRDE